MKLETRLETLEHEFKILKSEIQTTLLEIQEQILIHYYPNLRAEDSVPPSHLQDVVDTLRQQAQPRMNGHDRSPANGANGNGASGNGASGNGASGNGASGHGYTAERIPASSDRQPPLNGASSTFTDVTFEWADDEDEEDPLGWQTESPVLPQTREVSLADLKRPPHGAEQPPAPSAPGPAQASPVEALPVSSRPANATSQAQPLDFAAVAGWVGESIHKVGKGRAQKAVETYAAAVSLPAEVKEMLLQLIALSDDPDPTEAPSTAGVMDVLVKLDQVWRGGQSAQAAGAPPQAG